MKNLQPVFIFISILLTGKLFVSCQSTKEVERIEVTGIPVADDLECIMPGELLLAGDYLIWTNPFNKEGYLHIIDLKTGQESGPFIHIGQGPEEFTMPQLVKSHHQHVIVYDHLTDKIAWLDMNQTGTSSFIRHSHNEITREANRIVEIEDGEFLTLNTTQEPIFFFKGQQFGAGPFTEKAENLVDLLQGNLLYDPQKKCWFTLLCGFLI